MLAKPESKDLRAKIFLNDYLYFASIIIIFISFIIGWNIWSSYNADKEYKKVQISTNTQRLNNSFKESFDYVNDFMRYMSKKISQSGFNSTKDLLPFIADAINSTESNHNIFTWTGFDFVTPEGYTIASSGQGIIENPKLVTSDRRSWMITAKKKPGVLQHSKADLGILSNEPMIPVAIGIEDKNSNFLGYISMGFDINKVRNKIERTLSDQNIVFVILDNDNNVVMQSSNQTKAIYKDFFTHEHLDIKEGNESGEFKKAIKFGEIEFTNFIKVSNYPYTILTGRNTLLSSINFKKQVMPDIINLLGVTATFLLILFMYRRSIIKPIFDLSTAAGRFSEGEKIKRLPRSNSLEVMALSKKFLKAIRFMNHERIKARKAEKEKLKIEEKITIHKEHDKEKEEFLRDMYSELNTPLNAIINGADIARGKLLGDDIESYTEYFDAMYDAGIQLKCFTTELLYPQLLNINDIIEKCVKIQRKFASEQKSQLDYKKCDKIPEIWVDKIRIKQIILSTLYHSLFYVPASKKCTISTKVEYLAGGEPACLIIKVEDNGWGYDEKMRSDDWDVRFGKEATSSFSRNPDMMKLSISTIRNMVKLHHGSFDMQAKSGSGSIFTIRIPYLSKEDLIVHPDDYTKPSEKDTVQNQSNVVSFTR